MLKIKNIFLKILLKLVLSSQLKSSTSFTSMQNKMSDSEAKSIPEEKAQTAAAYVNIFYYIISGVIRMIIQLRVKEEVDKAFVGKYIVTLLRFYPLLINT